MKWIAFIKGKNYLNDNHVHSETLPEILAPF